MGTEIGSGHRLIDVLQETIHCILYCQHLLDFPWWIIDGTKLARVTIYARASKDVEVESIRKWINDFLSKHGEIPSHDILGIIIFVINGFGEEQFYLLFD